MHSKGTEQISSMWPTTLFDWTFWVLALKSPHPGQIRGVGNSGNQFQEEHSAAVWATSDRSGIERTR